MLFLLFVFTLIVYISLYIFSDLYFEKTKIRHNIKDILSFQVESLNIGVNLKTSEKAETGFVKELSQIIISPMNNIKSASEGFYHIGLAIHAQDIRIGFPHVWNKRLRTSFVVFMSLYIIQQIAQISFLNGLVTILALLSSIFFTVQLEDRVFSTYCAIRLIKEGDFFDEEIFAKIRLCLYNNLLGHIIPLISSVIILVIKVIPYVLTS